mmetsp:Transcript_4651/g.9353  ORF Transcript_4651/g.9353 Transcript_4651/m.9353 type:complete len:104 (+) Transcript_4651:603-914(+)
MRRGSNTRISSVFFATTTVFRDHALTEMHVTDAIARGNEERIVHPVIAYAGVYRWSVTRSVPRALCAKIAASNKGPTAKSKYFGRHAVDLGCVARTTFKPALL